MAISDPRRDLPAGQRLRDCPELHQTLALDVGAGMSKPRAQPSKLTIEQRMAIRRRVIEERKKGRMRDGSGSRVVEVMEELAAEYGVTFGCIQRTVYG